MEIWKVWCSMGKMCMSFHVKDDYAVVYATRVIADNDRVIRRLILREETGRFVTCEDVLNVDAIDKVAMLVECVGSCLDDVRYFVWDDGSITRTEACLAAFLDFERRGRRINRNV